MTVQNAAPKKEGLLTKLLYRTSVNLGFWIVTIFFVVWGAPAFGKYVLRAPSASQPFDFSILIDVRVWVIQLIGAALTLGFIHFLGSKKEESAKKAFVSFLFEDVFAILLSYGSIPFALLLCSIVLKSLRPNLSPEYFLYCGVNYALCTRLWFMYEGFKEQSVESGRNKERSDQEHQP